MIPTLEEFLQMLAGGVIITIVFWCVIVPCWRRKS